MLIRAAKQHAEASETWRPSYQLVMAAAHPTDPFSPRCSALQSSTLFVLLGCYLAGRCHDFVLYKAVLFARLGEMG